MKKHIIRTTFLLIIFNCSFVITKAQWVSIPDSNFGKWLNTNGYTTCLQGNSTVGWQMDTTCPKITGDTALIFFASPQIHDFKGLQYFDNLKEFFCTCDSLIILTELPNNLLKFQCHQSQLTSLPNLPSGLTLLSCISCKLTSLPDLPQTLVNLACQLNQLTTLPILPSSLVTLIAARNQLTFLPALPDSLNYLSVQYNQIITLPDLPNSIRSLGCDSNRLTSIPELPDSLGVLSCANNHNLLCFPKLKKVKSLDYRNTGIQCLPNYPQSNTYCYPSLDSIPICDLYNVNGCSVYGNISGKVYQDLNANCILDSMDFACNNIKLNLYQNGNLVQQTSSAGQGTYSFITDNSTYQYSIDTASLSFSVVCPHSFHYTSVITPLDSLDLDMNFGLECKPGFDLAAQSISGIFWAGQVQQLNVTAGDYSNFFGAHCISGVSGNVQLIIYGPVTYVAPANGALTPTTVSGDTITWNIPDFASINFFSDFNIMVYTDSAALAHTPVDVILIVNPIAGDKNPQNNVLTYRSIVRTSHDPNEKEVYPADNIDTATHWLTYTIHFQNTGTAEAQHIYVTDTLDSNIDAASFQLLAYSHQPMVQLKGNNLRFNFPNINLPDSNTNEPLSHGYVQYKVKLKDNLPLGTNINNTAFIYFDFNAPVVTNTTSNTIALATGLANLGMRNADFGLNPNPATESVRISIDESMIGSNLTITDITGREVFRSAVQIRNPQFDIRNLSPGVYFVSLENKTGSVTKRLVKQ